MDSLKEKISEFLSRSPNTKAAAIAKSFGVQRREVNSILYRFSREFESIGTDPPLWRLKTNSVEPVLEPQILHPRSPQEIARKSGLEERIIRSQKIIDDSIIQKFGVSFTMRGQSIEVHLVQRSISEPYVTYEKESDTSLVVLVNSTMLPEDISDVSVFQHVLHCVADALSFKLFEDRQGHVDRNDLFNIKSRYLVELISVVSHAK
jgi:hypothetical protein